jgi:predicted transcriptional regulator
LRPPIPGRPSQLRNQYAAYKRWLAYKSFTVEEVGRLRTKTPGDTRVEELAYDLKVSDVMSPAIHIVSPKMSMADLLEILRQEHISGTPVVESEKMVGIVSLEDLIRSMTAQDLNSPIEKYMTSKVIAAKSYDPVVEAIELFTTQHVGRLPVVDENENLVGIITKGDITRGVLIALQKRLP